MDRLATHPRSRIRRQAVRSIRLSQHQRFVVVVAGCVAACVLLRLPYVSLALGIDEGGLALVASQWSERSGSIYGGYWLDRSPLLLALYAPAAAFGEAGIRLLGFVAALGLVVLLAYVTRLLAGAAAGYVAAAMTALLMASPAVHTIFTPSELLAALPSAAAVGLLIASARRLEAGGTTPLQLFGAGLLAASAALVKQSFLCAIAAGLALALAYVLHAEHRRSALRRTAPLVVGLAVPVLLVQLWAATFGPGLSAFNYSMFGFRLDALEALRGSARPPRERIVQVVAPLVESGLIISLAAAVLGLRYLRGRSRLLYAMALAWMLGAALGVLAGGYYWRHYLIQLIPPAVVLGAVGLSRAKVSVAAVAVGATALITATSSLVAVHYLDRWPYQADVRAVVTVLDSHRRPGDTIQVIYARANLVYYSGMQSPVPYQWSSMYRVMPDAERTLRRSLASEDRPTWIVGWQSTRSFGLDRSGTTRQLIQSHYAKVAGVCGHPLYLRRERTAPGARQLAQSISCDSAGTSLSQILKRL